MASQGIGESLLTPNELNRLAELAKLELSPQELERLPAEMVSIVRYLQLVGKCPIPAQMVESHPSTPVPLPWREDGIHPSIDREIVLRAAPERLGDGFGVPKIIE